MRPRTDASPNWWKRGIFGAICISTAIGATATTPSRPWWQRLHPWGTSTWPSPTIHRASASPMDLPRTGWRPSARCSANSRSGTTSAILAGSEVDIRSDGRMDFPDEVLAGLDVVVASVHNAMSQDRDTMTQRIFRAMEHPSVDHHRPPIHSSAGTASSHRLRPRGGAAGGQGHGDGSGD